jgi:hypothetical protein
MNTTDPGNQQFSDQAPIMSLEWCILDRSHRLVDHIRQMRASKTTQEVGPLANMLKADVQNLQDMLKIVRDEAKAVADKQPISQNTEIEATPMEQAFRDAAQQRPGEQERH